MACSLTIAKKIIDGMFANQSILGMLKEYGINPRDFYDTIHSDPSLSNDYLRAFTARAELITDEMKEIADSDQNPMKVRNMLDTRKWLASKWNSQRFGDRLDLNVNQTTDVAAALAEARARAQLPSRDLNNTDSNQVIDVTPKSPDQGTGSKSVDEGDEYDIF